MTPTNRLRFVRREVPAPEYGPNIVKAIRVLQQWWEPEYHEFNAGKTGEWRDVPLEEEA